MARGSATEGLLAGKLFDDRGNRMSPTWARKRSKRWRYYVSQAALQGDKSKAGSIVCARYCRVNRLRSIHGAVCRTGERAVVYSAGPHHGEEDCLRGWRGSGTMFFSRCNLRCVYCQNWEISWQGEGQEASDEELAQMMLRLQALGCHNVNLVTLT